MTVPLAVASGIASMIGGERQQAASARMAREQMKFQERMFGQQMGFEERMSSTSHQREAADLEKAGLNRILSLGSGASTPGVGAPSGAMGEAQDSIGKGVGSAMEVRRLRATLDMQEAQIENIGADISLKHAQRDATLATIPVKSAVGDVAGDASSVYSRAKDLVSEYVSDKAHRDIGPVVERQIERARMEKRRQSDKATAVQIERARQRALEAQRRRGKAPHQTPYRYRGERSDSTYRERRP